jgi:hypothetical protein
MDNLPKIKFPDISGLRKFYDDLNVQIIENMCPEVVTDPRRMRLLSSKLPHNLVVARATYQEGHNIGADIRAFAEWLRKKVQILEGRSSIQYRFWRKPNGNDASFKATRVYGNTRRSYPN